MYIISTAPTHQEATALTCSVTALLKSYCMLDIINANSTLYAAPSHQKFSISKPLQGIHCEAATGSDGVVAEGVGDWYPLSWHLMRPVCI